MIPDVDSWFAELERYRVDHDCAYVRIQSYKIMSVALRGE